MLTSTSSDGRAVVKVTAKQPKSKKQTNLFILQKKKRKINQGLSFVQFRRGFRLPQRSHLRTLKNFVSEKSGKHCEIIGETLWKIEETLWKIGETFDKIGNREVLKRFIFFLVSALNKAFNIVRNSSYVSAEYKFKNCPNPLLSLIHI